MTVALEPSYSQICTLGTCIANCLCLVWVKSTVLVFRFMLLGWRCGMQFVLSFIVKHSRMCENGSNTESLNAVSGMETVANAWIWATASKVQSTVERLTSTQCSMFWHKETWLTADKGMESPFSFAHGLLVKFSSTACFANDCTKLVGTRCYFLKGNFFGGLWCAWILALVPKHPIPCHLKEGLFLCGSMWCMNPPPLRSCTPPDRKKNHTPTP